LAGLGADASAAARAERVAADRAGGQARAEGRAASRDDFLAMKPRSAASRLLCAALAAALTLSSFGPRGVAAAQEIAAGAASARVAGAPLVLPPASAPLAPLASAPSLLAAPVAAVPAVAASAAAAPSAATALAPSPAAASAPAAATASAAPVSAPTAPLPTAARAMVPAPTAGTADESAASLDALFDASRRAGKPAAAAPNATAPSADAPRLARRDAAAAPADAAEVPARAERENRSAYFPLSLAAFMAVSGLALKGAGALLSAVAAAHAAPAVLGVAALTAFTASGLLALNAVVDAAIFGVALRRGRGTTDEQFREFVRGEVLAGRLDSNAAALLKPYRPQSSADLTFAFAARGTIWIRPELIALPAIFRLVLLHELNHWKTAPTRGPPGRGVRGLLQRAYGESVARAAELRGTGGLKDIRVSPLERALRQAQVSLRREKPYEILVLNPASPELKDPKLYEGLSGGAATVVAREGAEPAAALGEAEGKDYRAVVLGGSAQALPKSDSKEAVKLESTLTQLDSLYVLATRLVARPEAFAAGSADARAYSELSDKAARLRRVGASPRVLLAFETEVRRFWRQIAATRLKGVGAADLVDRLYGGLRDRGTAFLSFGPDDHGVKTWERLLRYWESEEGGQFRVVRVDLEDGGHILILRKLEPRVGLWLRPVRGGRIATSVPRASDSEEGRALARQALLDAGFADQLQTFDQHDVVVRHVFGADVGRQEIYVTVPRRRAAAIRRFVQARAEATIGRSQTGFRTHLLESGEIQDVPPVWKAGITGAGGKILWIDTGADATHEDFAGRLDVIDMVDEGPEDWVGHGTHVAGISISGGAPFLGMAKGAHGTMAKVFSRDGNGASDGEIMGSAAIAQQKGYDVISLSLGSRGTSADNLSEFLSALTRQKNSAGEYPIVSASAGNAGPFDKSLSQPAAGVDVLAVAAAAKSLDDGRPEISFYSSVGPDVDRRFAAKRLRLKPEITGIGGDVTTAPGSSNVYKFGVYSAKSKDAPRSPSDLEDGRHTGMSGTSMSNPAVAGVALLVKLAMKTVGAFTPFVAENLPFAVKAVLMRTAKDLEAPVWFQGAGLVQAGAAVALVARTALKKTSMRVARLLVASPAQADEDWAWLERLKAVADAEDRVFAQAPAGSAPAAAADGPADDEAAPSDEPAEDEAPDNRAAADAARAAAMKRFSDARDREIPALAAALKDPVWLVRQRAAFALLNLRASSAALALGETALNDSDARVRQMAFLALAEIPTHAVDPLLRAASSDPRWDVGVYAAYALARRGDRGGADRIVREMGSADKRARFASAWLAGQLALQASSAEAEALSARLKDREERGNIRHLAAASLSNIADAAPQALSDRVVTDLLDAVGPDNIALTRTLSKIVPVALRDREFVARLRRDPLKPIVTDFILKNKSSLQKPGALADLVQTLARAAGVPLDAPTSTPDPSGTGVAGVDSALGPLDVFVLPPADAAPKTYADVSDPAALSAALAAAGVDAELLARFESAGRAALPVSRGFWLSVPEHELYAFSLALQSRGLKARLVQPETPLVAAAAPAATGGLTIDLSDEGPLTLAPDADLSLVRVRAAAGVSEARVMAALERIAARAKWNGPTVIALSLAAPTGRRTALSALIDRLALSGVGVVVGAGDGGPALGTTAAPADAQFAAVVAAAAPGAGLQFYSARGTPDSPRISWTENVDPLLPGQTADAARAAGTGAAAERSAEKLARLARVMENAYAATNTTLPEGWFPWLVALVRQSASPMNDYAPHEVGAGLFDDESRVRAALAARLADLGAINREAAALVESGRLALAGGASRSGAEPGLAGRAARGLLSAALAARAAAPGFLAQAFPEFSARAEASAPQAPRTPTVWWKDPSLVRKSETVPLYSLRRATDDPGIGKYADLSRYYRESLGPQGVEAVLLLPHFALNGESPYAPVSLDALDEDNVDWSLVPEVRARPDLRARLRAAPGSPQSVDYAALRAREGAVAREAYADFARGELARGGTRADDYRRFLTDSAGWLESYAEFMALSRRIGKPVLDWSADDVAAARAAEGFAADLDAHRFAQWIGRAQLKDALDEIHRAGGRVLFDVPMFRAKDGVDAWKRPELFKDLRTRNPGIMNAWTHEDWRDLALWDWTRLGAEGYRPALAPFERWLDFGFDGARVDAFHFAYSFGNGQLASGDEPGDPYAAALGAVFSARGALPLAEAFAGKDANARRFGFLTIDDAWRKVSSHDDPRSPDFLPRLFGEMREAAWRTGAKFVSWTIGDEWRDPFPVKEMRGGNSYWNYRIPLPSDADYANRARFDARPQLRVMKNVSDGDAWKDPAAIRTVLTAAADGFVKHDGGSVQIWAADMDWFLEEWGRDTFVSLPGLLLSTGRFEEAKENIRRFSRFEHDGLIPNRIWDASRWSPQNPDGADYNTSDAPMWFVQAVQKTAQASGDPAFAAEMAPVVRRIMARYRSGTGYQRFGRFNRIYMDSDGLVVTPAQSTWMDADPDGKDRPVTPRDGKAVEINALWYSNLRFLAALERRLGAAAAGDAAAALADKVKASFNEKFWFATADNRAAWGGSGGALRDVVDGDPHGDAIRPNMLFAVSRGGDLLSPDRRAAVVLAATRDLLTPYGPRTLSPRDSQYRERYVTSQPASEKDLAYHQGTVWPWLMGAYVDALARVRRDQGWSDARTQEETRGLMTPLMRALVSRPEGSLPEVFDGGRPDPVLARAALDDPRGLGVLLASAPTDQNPGGTRSQAWSVAEALRVVVERGLVPPGYDGSR